MTFDIRVLNVVYILLLLSILYLPLYIREYVLKFYELIGVGFFLIYQKTQFIIFRLGNLYAMEEKRKQRGSLGTPCCLSLQQCSHSRYCALLLLSRDLTCLVFRHLGNIVYMIQWSVAGSSTQLFGNQSDCTWLKIRQTYVMKLRVYSIHSLCQCDG